MTSNGTAPQRVGLGQTRRGALGAALCFAFGLGAAGSTGCRARPLLSTLRPDPPPDDPATTFHALIRAQPAPPLESAESPWQVAFDAPAGVELRGDALWLNSPPALQAWASPRLPVAMLGARPAQRLEELTWETTIELAERQRFFIVCELRFAGEPGTVLIQTTPFDLQITQDPDRPGGGTSASVSRLLGNGRPHFWRVRLDSRQVSLRLDGEVIWTLDGARTLSRVAFGETRSDREHGGTMLLRDVVYVRRPS